jgi:hypothetical protein
VPPAGHAGPVCNAPVEVSVEPGGGTLTRCTTCPYLLVTDPDYDL